MIRIKRASPYATIQDAGRRGFLATGVPRAGAMDMFAFHTLNALLGNDERCAEIEWALAGGEIVFEADSIFAIGGAAVEASIGDREVEPWRAYHAREGECLVVGPPTTGRFLYIAIAGGIDTMPLMKSRSTYLPGDFGGLDGRRLRHDDMLKIGEPSKRRRHQVSDQLPQDLQPVLTSERIRYVADEVDIPATWTVSSASDRTGYRLESDSRAEGASIVSRPVCPGTIQIPPGGKPIVLMADAPTIGGYRIAGAVISSDLGLLAQCKPGDTINLERTSVEVAQRELGKFAERLEAVRSWSLA